MDLVQAEAVDVLVLGGGMAGLGCARALAERGLRVLVLEAREHVGGRVMSRAAEGGGVVELGAEFVHGRAPELWALIEECGAEPVEREGVMLREREPESQDEGGRGGVVEGDPEDDDTTAPLEALAHLEPDVPFAEWLATSDVPEHERGALLGYVEGFNAADARRISSRSLGLQQRAEAEIEGDRAWHLPAGYQRLPEFLAARVKALGGAVRTGVEVRRVRWGAAGVAVETSAGEFRAARCVCALPLPIVQSVVAFDPEPDAVRATRALAMGHAVRFTTVWRERWWVRAAQANGMATEKLAAMSFLFTLRRMPPVWWTPHPECETAEAQPTIDCLPAITGWVGGPRARAVEGRSAAEWGAIACRELAEVFRVPEAEVCAALLATYTHDWSADPWSRGAYSYVPAGAIDAPAQASEPAGGALFFAGEHTDTTGHWGTVHAALRTGLRAARQVLGEDASG